MYEENKLKEITKEFGSPFKITSYKKDAPIGRVLSNFAEDRQVSLAGRIISKREHGRSIFAHISDYSGKIQIYLRKQELGDNFDIFKKLDIGDIVGFCGKLFRTRTGEPTVLITNLTLLSKSLLPLPEKWHGLKDVEIRYRQRYLDCIANPEVRNVFIKRSWIISLIRMFLSSYDYIEVETPILQFIPGGASGEPFKSFHNATDSEVYLRIAPELYLKRLLVGGFDRVYELGKNFRNEGISRRHSPEFTMLEAYCAYEDYNYMMKLCEDLFCLLVEKLYNSKIITYQGREIDFTPPWQRLSFVDIFKQEFEVAYDDPQEEILKKVEKKLKLPHGLSRSQILNITEDFIEKNYPKNKPIFIVDYFKWMSPLAKCKRNNPYVAERFELFIGGFEVANAYSELNDPIEQEERLKRQLETEEELPKKIDKDFILSLKYAMPPATGLGIGIDRIVMILLDKPSIKDVILFPLLKPLEE